MNNTKYSEKVKEHFLHPHNMGDMKNPDAIGIVGNKICGDVMKIFLKIEKNQENKEYIKDIKFQTMGCAAAISTSSMITDLAKEKALDDALKITNESVAKGLDGLPPIKMHCSNLAASALHKAIDNYNKGLDGNKVYKKEKTSVTCYHSK